MNVVFNSNDCGPCEVEADEVFVLFDSDDYGACDLVESFFANGEDFRESLFVFESFLAKGRNEILYKHLKAEERVMFDDAIAAEWKSILIDNEAVRVLQVRLPESDVLLLTGSCVVGLF